MPVIDHGQHDATAKISDQHRYGCHNRAPFNTAVVVENWNSVCVWPFRMSRECRYDGSLTDRACAGCKHAGLGERYIQEQNERGAK